MEVTGVMDLLTAIIWHYIDTCTGRQIQSDVKVAYALSSGMSGRHELMPFSISAFAELLGIDGMIGKSAVTPLD